jgi:hypothetical protein
MDDATERPAPYLTIKDVAAHYRVATKTVYRWIAAGLPALNVGSAQRPDYRLQLADVESFVRARQGTNGNPAPIERDLHDHKHDDG